MPKVTSPSFPLNGLFAVSKPSGMSSMMAVESLQKLFSDSPLFMSPEVLDKQRTSKKKPTRRSGERVKMGQGGTLDPLADGVLVIGVGKGTKSLGRFLHCTKEYTTTGLLGCETDSYDREGAQVRLAPWTHVTRDKVEETLARFRGHIKQVPPIYSALKMDGKPLYEYAREGKPLPRPIEARDAEVSQLELLDWLEPRSSENPNGHTFTWPGRKLAEMDKQRLRDIKSIIVQAEANRPPGEGVPATASLLQDLAQESEEIDTTNAGEIQPPAFVLKMTVSSGTYVRSIVHDLGLALGSAAHVVTLTRTRQGDFSLGESDTQGDCIPWSVFEQAIKDQTAGVRGSSLDAISDEAKRADWENIILDNWHE